MKVEPPLTPEAQSQEQLRQQQQQQQVHQQQMQSQLQGHLQGQPLQQQQFQPQQLPSAPVANMTGGGSAMRPMGYGGVGMGIPGSSELQHQKIEEELQEEM